MEDVRTHEEISQFLMDSYKYKISPNDLRRVREGSVLVQIYGLMLNELGFSDDFYYRSGNFESESCLSDPEHFKQILPLIRFWMTLKHGFSLIGFKKPLEFEEIVKPNPKEVRARMVVLINFIILFRELKNRALGIESKYIETDAICKQWEENVMQHKMKLNKEIMALETAKLQSGNAQKASQVYQKTLDDKANLKQHCAAVKEEITAVDETIKTMESNIAKIAAQTKNMDQIIVSDLEVEKEKIRELEAEYELTKRDRIEQQANLNKIKARSTTGVSFPQKDALRENENGLLGDVNQRMALQEELEQMTTRGQLLERLTRDDQQALVGLKEDLAFSKTDYAKKQMIYQKTIEDLVEKENVHAHSLENVTKELESSEKLESVKCFEVLQLLEQNRKDLRNEFDEMNLEYQKAYDFLANGIRDTLNLANSGLEGASKQLKMIQEIYSPKK